MTPLVGRDEELDTLRRAWQQAKSGAGRLVLLSGEPGIGKSRLLAALEDTLAADPHASLRYFCSPLHQDSTLHPIVARWEQEAGFTRGSSAEQRLRKLEAIVTPDDLPPEDVALIAAMLSLPTGIATRSSNSIRSGARSGRSARCSVGWTGSREAIPC